MSDNPDSFDRPLSALNLETPSDHLRSIKRSFQRRRNVFGTISVVFPSNALEVGAISEVEPLDHYE